MAIPFYKRYNIYMNKTKIHKNKKNRKNKKTRKIIKKMYILPNLTPDYISDVRELIFKEAPTNPIPLDDSLDIQGSYSPTVNKELVMLQSISREKVLDCNNENIMVTDRGTMFGYQDMIVDFRGIPTMQQFASTVLDVTHSLQQPNQMTGVTGGRPDMIETIAKAGIAVGVDGIFIETHFDPANAKSDGANMLHLDYFEGLMTKLVAIRKTVNQF